MGYGQSEILKPHASSRTMNIKKKSKELKPNTVVTMIHLDSSSLRGTYCTKLESIKIIYNGLINQ